MSANKITIYGMKGSAPVRIVLMAAELVGVDYEFKEVNLMTGENKKPEYLEINPQHNIPAMVDGDFKMNESRAIASYLANAYDKDAKLMPKGDAKKTAIVEHRMYFDMGTFYKAFGECFYPIAFRGAKEVEADKLERLHEVLGWVSGFVEATGYAAGTDHLTMADVCFVATLSTLVATGDLIVPNFAEKYPKLSTYLEKMAKEIPNYESANGEGATSLGQWVLSKTKTDA